VTVTASSARGSPVPAGAHQPGTDQAGAEILARPAQPQVALVDLLDRVLAGGVVIAGDVTLSIADVTLVRISLRALVVSIRDGMCGPADPQAGPAARGDPRP
jgi:hypothetical protein